MIFKLIAHVLRREVPSMPREVTPVKVNLPNLEIKTFGGDLNEWQTFDQMFLLVDRCSRNDISEKLINW